MMELILSSETSFHMLTTQNGSIHNYSCDRLKSYVIAIIQLVPLKAYADGGALLRVQHKNRLQSLKYKSGKNYETNIGTKVTRMPKTRI
jgi:hypothetical protein